jgi:hypothetical protein
VIEHITDDVAALREIHKALRPNGGVMITVPRHMFLWSSADTMAHHTRRYSGAQLRENVSAAGFQILRQLSFGMITLPLQYISRQFLLTKSDKASEVLELDTNSITILVLEKLLEIDHIPI